MICVEGIQLGTVGEWAAALGAFAAFGAAVAVIVMERKQIGNLEQERRVREQEHRERHAQPVSVWVSTLVGKVGASAVSGKLALHNGGVQPVYDLEWTLYHPLFEPTGSGKRVLPPQTQNHPRDYDFRCRPGETVPDGFTAGQISVDISFRDSVGRRWKRNDSGHLIELDETPQDRPSASGS